MTKEEWLRDTKIRKELRESNIIIKYNARIVYVDGSYYEWLSDEIKEKYTFEEIHNQLIKICWDVVSPKTKTMTIKFRNYGPEGKFDVIAALDEKHKR